MRLNFLAALLVVFAAVLGSCSKPATDDPNYAPTSLGEVPAVRLNFRYEADVPPPEVTTPAGAEERNQAVQADFDANRPQEVLDKTIPSPDSKRLLAIYHRSGDGPSEFRLDMYTADGRILKKITADTMAVHFPDTIRWAPDSSTLAFVAMVRGITVDETAMSPATDPETSTAPANQNTTPPTVEVSPDVNANVDANASTAAPTPAAPTGVLTFRTEQIYICNADGEAVRAITQNEGLIYFYYVWSADSTMLAAVAAKSIEWRYLEDRAELAGEVFVPMGRPRVIETNGRERRLDDALTAAQPVWSPDSSKIACAFDNPHQVRIYDARGNNPTQAAVPLRNHLLISSQAYDRDQATKLNADGEANTDSGGAPVANTNAAAPTTLPDERTLVSFNPIVALNWSVENLLYFQTAYIKRMKNDADSATSFTRWHRLVLSPQASSR